MMIAKSLTYNINIKFFFVQWRTFQMAHVLLIKMVFIFNTIYVIFKNIYINVNIKFKTTGFHAYKSYNLYKALL